MVSEFWCPISGFYVDIGGEFKNYKMEEFINKMRLKIEFGQVLDP